MVQHVSDSLSNTNEQLEQAAKAIGRSRQHRKVFEAIYNGKQRIKTVGELASRTSLTRKQVLISGRRFAGRHIVNQLKHQEDTAYEKIDFFHAHKTQILALAGNAKKLARLPTKRRVVVNLPKSVAIPSAGAKVGRVYIDDVSSFSKVKKIAGGDSLPDSVSESRFKRGIQRIIDEPGKFKDWGGEKSDLYTSRLRLNGKRCAAAFAFKGPGLKGRLVLGKMGKNGDQLPRLFQEDADVFFVQHWREIDASIIDTMRNLAVAKSVTTGKPLWYGIIDGKDSHRLFLAYPDKF